MRRKAHVHFLIQDGAPVFHSSWRPRRIASNLLFFLKCSASTGPLNQPHTSLPSRSRTAITPQASLITHFSHAWGSSYSPAKPPAELAADACVVEPAAVVDVVAISVPSRPRAHQPQAMPLQRRTTCNDSTYNQAKATQHGKARTARVSGMSPAGILMRLVVLAKRKTMWRW